MDLYYLNFNNYYNRQVKRFDTLAEYLPFLLDAPDANRNFNPANDITITFIANRTRVNVGDYFLAVEDGEIKSRWFILNGNRTRQGQYNITARRDVIADYYSQTISSPCFIEKATLNSGDPMIFNKEDMTVNQIKTSEKLLKDRTGCPWVVGYIPSDSFASEETIYSKYISPNFNIDAEYDNLSDFPYYDFQTDLFYDKPYQFFIKTYVGYSLQPYDKSVQLRLNLNSGYTDTAILSRSWTQGSGLYGNPLSAGQFYGALSTSQTYRDSVYNSLLGYTWYGENISTNPADFFSWNNKIIRVGTNPNSYQYYRINIEQGLSAGINHSIPANIGNSIILPYLNLSGVNGTADSDTYYVENASHTYHVVFTQLYSEAFVKIDNTRVHLEDSPYDMFCIPYSDDLQIKLSGSNYCVANKSLALSIANAIVLKLPGKIFDLQLLPYCPLQRAIKANGDFDIVNEVYDVITDANNSKLGVVLWCDSSNFSFDIENEIIVSNPKVVNQCDLFRLVSPNYNGQFDFNVAMNGGMTKFNIDCTYKPFSPYIHINPDFNLLYGSDFNDARGLICGGDFSLPQMSSAWESYQMQNKNYLNIFDRQIQNMETNYYYQNMSQLMSGSINALSTGISTGVLAGAGFGVASGLSSAAGMLTDYYINKQVQNEAIDYTKDLFGYNLGNIQAIPQSLSKVTAFNENNKLFPFLEYYTCTQEERTAFENKIRWNGMTVMRIGTISEFIWDGQETYIKGKIIRLLDVDEPTNVLNEIANEINKGVYI